MNIVAHNLVAMNANRMYGITEKKRASSIEKLSSGYKINRAADDAAGLAISEKMRRQIRGLTQASLNAQDGISMVQIADGAMAEVADMLHRGTELSVQAANGTLTDTDRKYLNEELEQLKKEIDRISHATKFNDIQVLRGKDVEPTITPGNASVLGGLPAWVSIDSNSKSSGNLGATIEIEHNFQYSYEDENGDTQTGTDKVTVKHAGSKIDFSGLDGLTGDDLNKKIEELTKKNSGFYTTCCTCTNHYSINLVNGGGNSTEKSGDHTIYSVDISGVTSGEEIIDKILACTGTSPGNHYTNFAKDSDNPGTLIVYENRGYDQSAGNTIKAFLEDKIGSQYTYSISNVTPRVGWISDTARPSSSYGLFGPGVARDKYDIVEDDPETIILQVGSEKGHEMPIDLPSISTGSLKLTDVNISTQNGAKNALTSFENALNYVSTERSRMGAYQNRLEHTIANLNNVIENTQSAESSIRDTDMATEMVRLANQNILSQAGVSMLTQANQQQETVLSLIQ